MTRPQRGRSPLSQQGRDNGHLSRNQKSRSCGGCCEKAFSELKKGMSVIMANQDWKVMMEAESVEVFMKKLLQVLEEAGLA
jgi:hypothetical protein